MNCRGAQVAASWAVLATLLSLAAANPAFAINVRTVALRFQQAPGTSDPQDYFTTFSQVSLNDSGRVAFLGYFGGGGQGIWMEANGTLTYIARQGDQAKDAPAGVTFASFSALTLNDAGQFAFQAGLNGPNGQGIWTNVSGQLGLALRTGQPAPGLPAGSTIVTLSGPSNQVSPVFNNQGQLAIYGTASVGAAPSPTVIWMGTPGNIGLVARTGVQANGLPTGANFSALWMPALNHSGQVAFSGNYNGIGVTPGSGVWVGNVGGVAPIANTGVAAPGSPGNYGTFTSYIGLNDAGDAAFHGSALPTGGFWTGHAGSLAALALKGMQAPGTAPGTTFDFFTVPAFMSNNGATAFTATLAGDGVNDANDRGMWLSKSGNLSLVAREGEAAPGAGSGVSFGSISSPAINEVGQLAFRAELIGAGVDSSNGVGIWVTNGAEQPQLILRTGDTLEVAPGDIRTISTLNFDGNGAPSDGRANGFNKWGQLAFTAAFTNGTTGLFVTAPIAVPEPATFYLALAFLWGALGLEKRRY